MAAASVSGLEANGFLLLSDPPISDKALGLVAQPYSPKCCCEAISVEAALLSAVRFCMTLVRVTESCAASWKSLLA